MNTSAALDVLGALSQHSPLSIFRLLVRHVPSGLPAGEIARRLRLPKPTLSFHLNVLAAANLVRPRRSGRSITYSPELDCVNALGGFLMENYCGGQRECWTPSMKPSRPSSRTRERTSAKPKGG